jgi:septum formation protein
MGIWLFAQKLVLASKSEVRRAVLVAAGLPVDVVPADIDERAIEVQVGRQAPGAVAALLAREKSLAITRRVPGRLVVGADQTLALGPRRFSKPPDLDAAREQLKALRGQSHELHTAIALACDSEILFEHQDIARLTMRNFSDAFLDSYLAVAGVGVTASVGAYQLERFGIHLFERIEGDHFTILGLPLLPLLAELRRRQCLAD